MTLVQIAKHFLAERYWLFCFRTLLSINQLEETWEELHYQSNTQKCHKLISIRVLLTTVTPNITTNRREAKAMTITAMPHCGRNDSSSGVTGVGASRLGKTKQKK